MVPAGVVVVATGHAAAVTTPFVEDEAVEAMLGERVGGNGAGEAGTDNETIGFWVDIIHGMIILYI